MDLREIGWGGMDWLRIGTSVDSSEHSNKTSGCVKCREAFEQLSYWWLLSFTELVSLLLLVIVSLLHNFG
jgi:hypothetical protein